MIYLDSAASTLPRNEVLLRFEEMARRYYANPSSNHGLGREADRVLSQCRKELLDTFSLAKTHQILFTSGATESNNLALIGLALQYRNRGNRVLVSAVEHPSVLEPVAYLEKEFGFEVIRLPVDEWGRVAPKTLEEALNDKTILVSIMGVNNETGAINDLKALADLVHRYPKCQFHSDLTQAIGKVAVPYSCLDAFSFSGHKIHGIKGSGALVYKSSLRFVPVLHGGGQEFGFRSGTVSLPLCASLAEATTLARKEEKEGIAHAKTLFDALIQGISPEYVRWNSSSEGSPYVANFSLIKHKASVIVEALSEAGIFVSSASACSSRNDKTSKVLLAMNKSEEDASNAIRVSFSRENTLEEILTFVQTLNRFFLEVHAR